MAKLSPEQLMAIAFKPSEFGFASFALYDVESHDELDVLDYLRAVAVCLMVNEGRPGLSILTRNPIDQDGHKYYLDLLKSIGDMETTPVGKEHVKEKVGTAHIKSIADSNGLPMAIISLLESDEGELLARLDTFPGADPTEILEMIASTADRVDEPITIPSRKNSKNYLQ